MSTLLFPRPFVSSTRSICRSCRLLLQQRSHQQSLSTATTRPATTRTKKPKKTPALLNPSAQVSGENVQNVPRWAATPAAMQAPVKTRPPNANDDYPVNEDPAKLQKVLANILGSDEAANDIPEELRWLAVTHKSFDHGRRGFNDRLAFLGKRLVEMHTSMALVDMPQATATVKATAEVDGYGRVPFVHHALKGLENLPKEERLLERDRVATLAARYGLQGVLRWKPRQIHDLKASGVNGVLAHALYAIVGAVALQRGGEVALQIVKQRILTPLGVSE